MTKTEDRERSGTSAHTLMTTDCQDKLYSGEKVPRETASIPCTLRPRV